MARPLQLDPIVQVSDRILVVDDDELSRQALAEILDDEGFEVEVACDGAEALAMIRRDPPALVISDVRMPCVSGLSLVQSLRARPTTAHTPVILVSALAERDRRLAGLAVGADHYLGKPIDPQELLLRVRGALRAVYHQRELERRAMVDPLTGVLNRRGFVAELRRERVRAARAKVPLSVLVLDLDRFKRLNDEHGHQAGDAALRLVTRTLVEEVRAADRVGRLGGDELAVILPGADEAAAALVADRVRGRTLPPLVVAGDREVAVSMSVGRATLEPGETLDHLLDRADRDMYRHKRSS